MARSERLFARVLAEYGDDSVAQLGGAHVAVEGASNLLTKVLEWGRLMAYLEQSTRYIPYTQRDGGRWRYHVPAEIDGLAAARAIRRHARPRVRRVRALAAIRRSPTSSSSVPTGGRGRPAPFRRRRAPRRSTRCAACCRRRRRRTSASSAAARRTSCCCCACARIRWPRCAPAPTAMRAELEQVIPAFLTRVDRAGARRRVERIPGGDARGDRAGRRPRCSPACGRSRATR